MKTNHLRCIGLLALAVLGISVSARADSVYEEMLATGVGDGSGNFALPAVGAQPQFLRERATSLCCWSGMPNVSPSIGGFSWFAEPSSRRASVLAVNKRASSSFEDPRSTPSIAIGGKNEYTMPDAGTSNDSSTVGADFEQGWYSGLFYGGPGGPTAGALTAALNKPEHGGVFGEGASIPDPQMYDPDGKGKIFRIRPIGVKRGPGDPPVPIAAPVSVSEPSLLALLGTALSAMGLLMLKRTA